MIEKLIEHLSALDDPRCAGKVEHRLIAILVIVVCAVIACAESWEDIALYGRSKQDWLRRFLALPHGIPSRETFRRVFMLIDPEAFKARFTAWAQGLVPRSEHEVVAIDGKIVCHSFDRGRAQAPLHLVSAWASEQGLALDGTRFLAPDGAESPADHREGWWEWLKAALGYEPAFQMSFPPSALSTGVSV